MRIQLNKFKSNNLLVPSCEQVINLLFEIISILLTELLCSLIVFKHSPVSIFHILIVLSFDPLINFDPVAFFTHNTPSV